MSKSKTFPHKDKIYFKSAVESKSDQSGFVPLLIEKDYFCSLILRELYSEDERIIFKGGTLLNKVHTGFYRLSEDLDFSISISSKASRKERSKKASPFKAIIKKIAETIPGLNLKEVLSGSNNSTQYNAKFEYDSVFEISKGSILFEIGLREKALEPTIKKPASTLVADPINDQTLLPAFYVSCFSKKEAYSEKLRAALTRTKPAIRDIFDIDYAIRAKKLDVDHSKFKELVSTKLSTPVKKEIDVSDSKKQLSTQLAPVLRPQDFNAFDLHSAWQKLCKISEAYVK